MHRPIRLIRLTLGAALLFGASTLAARAQDTLVVAQPTDVISMNPMTDPSLQSLNVFRNVFDQLTQIDAEGRVVPWLATAWEGTADQKTWTFTLRHGVKFHNGTPVTAEDVIWSYDAVRQDPKSAVRPYLSRVTSVEKVADDQIRFNLSSPFVLWPRQTSLISILPKDGPKGSDGAPLPIGSGAFKFINWSKDDKVELEANPGWWGGAPAIKKLVFRPVPSDASRASALISGELNVVPILPPSQLPRLEARDDVKIYKLQSNRNVYIGINVNVPLLADKKLREAMNHAIDRTAITQRLIRGYGTPMNQFVAPKVFGHDPFLTPVSYDPALAKKLVGESNYKGEKIIFTYTTNQVAYGDQLAQAIANYLQAVGIAVELQPLEAAATTQLSIGRKYPGLFMAIFGPSIMDADLAITLYFEQGNRGYWMNDEAQALAVAQRAEGDPVKRAQLISKIWQLANADSAYLFLYNETWAFGMSPNVVWTPAPDGGLTFQYAQFAKPK